MPAPLPVACGSGGCAVDIPNDGDSYCVKEYRQAQLVPSNPDALAARLLGQATFGATEAGIAHVRDPSGINGAASAFVAEQLAVPATLLREHLRVRSASKQLGDDEYGVLRSGCEPRSRWHRHALQYLDIGRQLTVVLGGVTPGWYALRVDGVLVSEVGAFSPGAVRSQCVGCRSTAG